MQSERAYDEPAQFVDIPIDSSVPNDQPYFDLDALCSPEAYIQLTSDLMLDPLQSHATVHASSAEQGDVELWDEWCYNGGGVDFCNWENLLSSLAQNEYQSSTLATPLVYYTTASTSSNGISNIQDAATPTVSTYTATVPDIQDAVTPTVSTFPVTIPENQDAATPSVSDIQDEATPAIRKNFTCSFCKKTHDRQDRLESCENGHKGRKPHICGGKCGDPDWYLIYLLDD